MIDQFRGEYEFLSNFYFKEIEHCGLTYKTAEHLYQSFKCADPIERMLFSGPYIPNPGSAKKLARKVKLREDWEDIKYDIMTFVIDLKFKDEELAQKLLDTGSQELVEGNTWGDTFWGIDLETRKGFNYLGNILMTKRNQLRLEQFSQ